MHLGAVLPGAVDERRRGRPAGARRRRQEACGPARGTGVAVQEETAGRGAAAVVVVVDVVVVVQRRQEGRRRTAVDGSGQGDPLRSCQRIERFSVPRSEVVPGGSFRSGRMAKSKSKFTQSPF